MRKEEEMTSRLLWVIRGTCGTLGRFLLGREILRELGIGHGGSCVDTT